LLQLLPYSYVNEEEVVMRARYAGRAIAALGIIVMFTGCALTKGKNLQSEVSGIEGKSYPVTQNVLNKLQLPAPGIDPANTAAVTDYPDQNILEVAVGPVSLPDGTPHTLRPISVTAFPFDFWLTGYDWAITDGEGNDLTPALLHHFNIIDPNRRELFYPIARRIFAAGRETPAATMPPMVGVPVRGNAPMLLVTMLANTTGTDYSDVYFRLWISYTTRDEATIKPKSVYPLYIDSGGPVGPRSYEVPPGETVEAYSAAPATGGRIVALGGHLHDYGKRLILRDMTADKTIWNAKPLTDGPDHVTGMPVKVFPFPWQGKLDPDHTYRIQARYENPTSENAPDRGMGSIGGVFILSGNMEWASPDYNNPTYLDDMVITLGSPRFHHWRELSPDEMRARLGIASAAR